MLGLDSSNASSWTKIVEHLPDYIRPLVIAGYITGWRINSELRTRTWVHVDLKKPGWLRLEPGETKNDEGREFPLLTPLREFLKKWREKGRWPASYDELWSKLNHRHGKLERTRHMVELVQLGREHGYDKLREAVNQALELGCTDADAIRHLVESSLLRHEQAQALGDVELGELTKYERALPDVSHYNALIAEVNS